LTGNTIEPHFFPIGIQEVHLFDFFVFPEYRGRCINPSLVMHILDELAADGKSRAFIEVEAWNWVELSSLSLTPFRPLGLALRFRILGKTLVLWSTAFPSPQIGS
jgi:ribosomal protein S18 acetylase RimI-like enzyme